MATRKGPSQEVEMGLSLGIETIPTQQSEIHHLNEKVFDGDEALKVLHTHYEPYSQAEEKRLLRKIDFRMCSLMLIISKQFQVVNLPAQPKNMVDILQYSKGFRLLMTPLISRRTSIY
jgi:hypothetical protein